MALLEARVALFPVKFADVWAFYKRSLAALWVVEEVDLSGDDITTLSPCLREMFCHILVFLERGDAIVCDNIFDNILAEVRMPEAKACYAVQACVETVHHEMYGLLVATFLSALELHEHREEAMTRLPYVMKKINWVEKCALKSMSLPARLVAFVFVEGLFFSSSFVFMFWLRNLGKLPGTCTANEFISRDEALHCDFALLLYSKCEPVDQPFIYELARDAVNIEVAFYDAALAAGVREGGRDESVLSSQRMRAYIEFTANNLLVRLGLPLLFAESTENPFPFMESTCLQSKVNFFERVNTSYVRDGGARKSSDFVLSDKF
jgi:ribonucleoside-diphosphate reductase beta chain